jgi:pseudouridine-5'-phosphate glycosidase
VIVVSEQVRQALADRVPVVAMESTIYSTLGLPVPHNAEALRRCTAAVEAGGAVPAVTAVVDGRWRVGLSADEEERVLAGTRKVAERDLAVAAASRGTSASRRSRRAWRSPPARASRSSPPAASGRAPRGRGERRRLRRPRRARLPPGRHGLRRREVLPRPRRTLEHLETTGVPVLGWRSPTSRVLRALERAARPHVVETADEVARVLRARSRPQTGVLLTVPIPEATSWTASARRALTRPRAGRAGGASRRRGHAVRLERVAARPRAAACPANLALAANNAASRAGRRRPSTPRRP